MYKDIISYELADGISEEHLLKVAGQIVEDWMKKLPGFIAWEITKTKDNNYYDIVFWENEESAKAAEKEMQNIPNAMDWFSCYKTGTINSKNLFLVKKF